MQRPLRFLTLAASALALCSCTGTQAWNMGKPAPVIDGSAAIDVSVGCGGSTYPADTNSSPDSTPRFTYVVENPIAHFISVHFSKFNLPANDYVVIRATANASLKSYTYKGKDFNSSFFSDTIYTKSVTVELYTTGSGPGVDASAAPGFAIDNYQYLAQAASFENAGGLESICGKDETVEAACYGDTPKVEKSSEAVVRLLIRKTVVENGESKRKSYFCTGWLVGEEGHVMTNNHCIANQDHASDTEFMFDAQGHKCDDFCGVAFGCSSDVTAKSSELIISNPDLDYALVKIDKKWAKKYGYLKMRKSGAALGERIYIVQHPAGWGKRVAMKANEQGDWGTVTSLTAPGCLANQVAYALDTQGGSSGSPVISWDDNVVVAIHHCGGCDNTAVNMAKIAEDLRVRGLLPSDSVV